MRLELFIATRYLFAKKKQNAINIVSIISVCGVAVGTMALVCVLSVFNGFQGIIEGLFSNFDPQVRISSNEGKVFDIEDIAPFLEDESIASYSLVLQENALVKYREKQMPVLVKGVDANYNVVNSIDSIMIDGTFQLSHGNFNLSVGGIALVRTLGCGTHGVEPVMLYAPKRVGKINPLRPDDNFKREITFLSSVFMVQQEKYDNNLIIISLDAARRLFSYDKEVSCVEIKLKEGVNESRFISSLQKQLGDGFDVQDRFHQQEDFFKMMQIEKWVTYLILSFIVLIAVFNVIGSLSMLIIEKKADIKNLENMGASRRLIFRIFLFEGWMISLLGAFVGIILGLILCLLQQHFGLISLSGASSGAFVSAYPVSVVPADVFLIFITVCFFGFLAAWYPAKQILKK